METQNQTFDGAEPGTMENQEDVGEPTDGGTNPAGPEGLLDHHGPRFQTTAGGLNDGDQQQNPDLEVLEGILRDLAAENAALREHLRLSLEQQFVYYNRMQIANRWALEYKTQLEELQQLMVDSTAEAAADVDWKTQRCRMHQEIDQLQLQIQEAAGDLEEQEARHQENREELERVAERLEAELKELQNKSNNGTEERETEEQPAPDKKSKRKKQRSGCSLS